MPDHRHSEEEGALKFGNDFLGPLTMEVFDWVSALIAPCRYRLRKNIRAVALYDGLLATCLRLRQLYEFTGLSGHLGLHGGRRAMDRHLMAP